jgi:protease-4
VQDVYGQFVDVVADERRLPRAEVLAVADGRVVSGRQAVERGLIDRIGNLTDAIAVAGRMAGLGSDPALARPREDRPTLLDVLLARTPLGALGGAGALRAVDAPTLKYIVPW